MAITWQWKDKCGEFITEQILDNEVRQFTHSLYEGNCFLIMLNEWEEDGVNKYSLYSFFADETHAKNCLGLTKGHTNMWTDSWDRVIKIRINKKKSRNWKKIVTLFAQAFDNIEIEIYSEDDKND